MEDSTAVATIRRDVVNIEDYAMPIEKLVAQVNVVQNAMRSVMREGEHYGKIPGTNKPTLLKPGAEKLGVTFRLVPSYSEQVIDIGTNGHREYRVKCSLTHAPTGQFFGEGLGSCSTMENKYRYRTGPGDSTGIGVPKAYWDARKDDPSKAAKIIKDMANAAGFLGDRFNTQKDDSGQWVITTKSEKVEHDNPADYYNTCLKMAKKRAHVDAILTATAASDIFTQDVEDLRDNGVIVSINHSREVRENIIDIGTDRTDTQKAITNKQNRALWAKGRALGVPDDDIQSFLKWVAPVTMQDASSLIEHFDAQWSAWIKHVDASPSVEPESVPF
jgi:hypothetical protein